MIRLTPQHTKALIILCAVLAVLLFITVTFNAITKVKVKISVSPADATLTVDGKNVAVANEIELTKGTHTLKASRADFTDAVKTIDTAKLDLSKTVYLLLTPANAAGQEWLNTHPDEVMKRESADGYEFSDTQKNILNRYPIVAQLPRTTLDYVIDYIVDEDKDITFIVTVKPYAKPENKNDYQQQVTDFKQEALTFLTQNGVDIQKARITHKEQSEWQ